MAEGTEKSECSSAKNGDTTCHQQIAPLENNDPKAAGEESACSLSSTESLTMNDIPLGDEELLMMSMSGGGDVKSCLLRERSKTPPPIKSSQIDIGREFIANFNSINNSLKFSSRDGEKSRDSGVHLDEMSFTPCGDEDRAGSTTTGTGCGSANGPTESCSATLSTSTQPPADADPSRRHSKSSSLPHGVKLCPETGNTQSNDKQNVTASSSSLSDREDDKWVSLEEELRKAQTELKAKDAEVEVLKGIRQQVEGELEDLTASLFEEAHKMVKEAKMKEVASEKSLKEAKMQLEGLQAEVAALKALLITSTPSRPNLGGGNGISIFKKQHKRTPSHNHLQYGRADEESSASEKSSKTNEVMIDRSRCEVDPILLSHFAAWRVEPTLIREKDPFLQKMYTEDIDPCLTFANESLVNRLKKAIEDNSIWVEPLPEKDRTMVPKECALLCCPKICHYRMSFAFESDDWFDISQICRDRIAAVCEFLNYLRYIKNGLVKASVEDAYWEMLRLRKQMTLAKLGIAIS